MELVAEDGCVVFIPEGCKKELGRGPGIATKDCTVSRHQILLELQKPSKEVSLVGHDSSLGGLLVKVLGANPVCIVHIQQGLKPTGRLSDAQEMVLLRKGETDTLSLGDKISLSIRRPVFFTVKEGGRRMKDASSRFIERSGSSAVVPKREITLPNVEVGNQATENDLLGKWRDRKKGKETGPSNTDGTKLLKAVGSACSSGDKEVPANEEEEGIAQAVARRQRRAYERRQQQEQKPQGEIIGRLREAGETSTVQFGEGQEEEYNYGETEGIDLPKEFGFLVEGSEFEQYKKSHRLDGSKGVWPLSKPSSDQDDDEQDNKVVVMGHHTLSCRKKLKKDDDDEEWRGEDLDEKVAVASAKKSKLVAKVTLRSHGPSSSKKVPTGGKKGAGRSVDRDPSGMNGDGDEDEEDETLGGFIVDDDEEEEDLLDDDDDDEEESCDDDKMDEEEEEEEEDAQQQKKQSKRKKEEKPLCRYGKGCYRKNKEHLEQYEH